MRLFSIAWLLLGVTGVIGIGKYEKILLVVIRYEDIDPSFSDISGYLLSVGFDPSKILVIDAYGPGLFIPLDGGGPDEYTAAYNVTFLSRGLLLWKALSGMPSASFPAPSPQTLSRAFSHVLSLNQAFENMYETVLVLESTLPLSQSVQAWLDAGIRFDSLLQEADATSSGKWQIIQLSHNTNPYTSGHAHAITEGKLVVPKHPCSPALMFEGAEAYLIRRSRIWQILKPFTTSLDKGVIDLRKLTLRMDTDYLLYSTPEAYTTAIPFSQPRLHSLESIVASLYTTAAKEKAEPSYSKSASHASYLLLSSSLHQLQDDTYKSLDAAIAAFCSDKEYPCYEQLKVLIDSSKDLCTPKGPQSDRAVSLMFLYDSVLMRSTWDGRRASERSGLFTFCGDQVQAYPSNRQRAEAMEECRNLIKGASFIDGLHFGSEVQGSQQMVRGAPAFHMLSSIAGQLPLTEGKGLHPIQASLPRDGKHLPADEPQLEFDVEWDIEALNERNSSGHPDCIQFIREVPQKTFTAEQPLPFATKPLPPLMPLDPDFSAQLLRDHCGWKAPESFFDSLNKEPDSLSFLMATTNKHCPFSSLPFISVDLWIDHADISITRANPDVQELENRIHKVCNDPSTPKACIVHMESEVLFSDVVGATFLMRIIEQPFVFVTSSNDDLCLPYGTVPRSASPYPLASLSVVDELIRSRLLIRWYSKNMCIHPAHTAAKLLPVPIGPKFQWVSTDFFGEHKQPVKNNLMDAGALEPRLNFLREKKKALLVSMNVENNYHSRYHPSRGLRLVWMNHMEELRKGEVNGTGFAIIAPTRLSHRDYLFELGRIAFTLAPTGCGLDTHRVWEALSLGCIPIVARDPMISLFERLPVVVISDISEVTQENLMAWYKELHSVEKVKTYEWERLTPFWHLQRIDRDTLKKQHVLETISAAG